MIILSIKVLVTKGQQPYDNETKFRINFDSM
jgi:P pilus assembly chaperone PapD